MRRVAMESAFITISQTQPSQRPTYRTSIVITMDSFRKIDVDRYDEDVLLEEELIDLDTRSPAELVGIAQQKATEVRSLIGRYVEQRGMVHLVVPLIDIIDLQRRCARCTGRRLGRSAVRGRECKRKGGCAHKAGPAFGAN